MNARKLFAGAVEKWPAKVLSLGLAIILFVFHRMLTLETRFLSAPIVIERLNAMMPSSSYPRMIRVSLRGEANSIYSILDDDIEVYMDMEKFDAPGTYTIPVQWRKKGTALGVEPLQISVDPPEITISLDRRISKFVPITANIRGQVESGYDMTSYILNPAQIIVDGPAELMWGVSEVYTEQIDLDGRISDFSITAAILQRDPLIIIRGNGFTEFRGIITQIVPVRNILNVPIIITGIGENLSGELETKAGSIHVEGNDQEEVNRFVPALDFLKVDCSGISEPGVYVLRVAAGYAGNLRLRVEPREVKIIINNIGDERP